MTLHLWGTDFKRSDSDFRTRLFLPTEKRATMLRALLKLGFQDLFYLQTCNRVEFYTTAKDYAVDLRNQWKSMLKALGYGEEDYFRGYHLEGKGALRHIARVASSLESLAVGEPQILGQVKEALQWTLENQLPLEKGLMRSLQFALETSKEIRKVSQLGEKPVSISSLMLRRLEALESKYPLTQVAVVGRGSMSLHALQWLQKNRPQIPTFWVNRTVTSIEKEAFRFNAKAISLEQFLTMPPTLSHLISATSSSQPIFNREFFIQMGAQCIAFDLAEPRDIDETDLPSEVCLFRLDDFRQESHSNVAARRDCIERAEEILEENLRTHLQNQKEAPILKEFSSLEKHLLDEVDEESARKLIRNHFHRSREHLRHCLRKLADEDHAWSH